MQRKARSSRPEVFCIKKGFLEISENSQLFSCEFYEICKKETLAQVFSCEFWETSKSTFSYRTAPGGCFSTTSLSLRFSLILMRLKGLHWVYYFS